MVKAFALMLLLPCLALAAPEAVPVIDRPVIDQVGLLSAAERERVARALVDLRARTKAQMAVLIVDTTSGEPIEDYMMRVVRQWHGGQAGANNGVLLMLAVKDRRMRLEMGYAIEEFLPDDAARRLLDAQAPLMRQKNFVGAIIQIIEAVGQRLPVREDSVDAQAPAVPDAQASAVPDAPRADPYRIVAEACLWGMFLFVVCAFLLRPSMYRWMGPPVAAVMCMGLLGLPVVFILHGAWGNKALIFKALLPLVMGGGLFFLGRALVVNTSWMRWGACLMMGSLMALLVCVGKPEDASLKIVVILSAVFAFIVLLSSFMMVGNLLVVPWMFVFGSREIVRRWWSPPSPGRSYSSSSSSLSDTYSSSSSSSFSSSSSSDTSPSSWVNLSSAASSSYDPSSSSSSYDSSSSSSSYDSSSSSSSYDSSSSSSYDSSSSSSSYDSSSSSSYDSSSSSSSYDSSSSSSSSSDWSGGGGDFGGGGSSSSW